jgi:hypothetical protein
MSCMALGSKACTASSTEARHRTSGRTLLTNLAHANAGGRLLVDRCTAAMQKGCMARRPQELASPRSPWLLPPPSIALLPPWRTQMQPARVLPETVLKFDCPRGAAWEVCRALSSPQGASAISPRLCFGFTRQGVVCAYSGP